MSDHPTANPDRGPEFNEVERPLIDQLVAMGWEHTPGHLGDPAATLRGSFRDVLLESDLRAALARINLGPDGQPWLDDGRVGQAIAALERHGARKLMEANQAVTDRLLSGTAVEGLPGWDGGRSRTVHYIDWDHPDRNTFRVINQFRLDEPGGQAHKYIVPDLVLFVNGIPLVVIECKSPYLPEPIVEAIDQLQRYGNLRHWIDDHEGNERLYQFAQLLAATCGNEARAGTVGAASVHFLAWKDTSPIPMADVARSLGTDRLSSQETLAAGMLRPAHLLDLVRHFTLFAQVPGRTIKLVARYQQFRAVHEAIHRLKTGPTRSQDGDQDRRGGIVWHTQGSGKSLTMVFLVRKMRSEPQLRRFKIVVVTDRTDLQDQLSGVAALTGDVVRVAASSSQLKQFLAEPGAGLVFAMIQKYREPTPGEPADEAEREGGGITDREAEVGAFPVLNEDESILVLVDEAHRSQSSGLHANLLKALPNCARIGFTGTPILMGDRKRTHEIFGDFIDRYTIKQSEADGATVPILYEGRTAEGDLVDQQGLDAGFADLFHDPSPEELERLKQRYATEGNILEAPRLIAAKARDMLRHYVANVLPNGFKAQVVASSRRAAVRYFDAFQTARAALVARLDTLDPALLELTPEQREHLDDDQRFLVEAHRYRDTIRSLEFAPVISGAPNDNPAYAEWTDGTRIKTRIDRFKKPLRDDDDPDRCDPLAFLIVKSMLLTGFDAPVEQALYLDRPIKAHELLQAIARVNRTYAHKPAGIVVDYYGVARHLSEALAVYASEDVEGALTSLDDEVPILRDRHERVVGLFRDRGIDLRDIEGCVGLLADEKLRARFQVALKQFLTSLEIVLPRPEASPFVADARTLGFIQLRVRNRYHTDDRPIGRDIGAKVRQLIDEHVVARGVDPSIPPISILDADFERHVEEAGSPRAKAAEMEHALRYHIRRHYDEDPEHYQKLSERLEAILADMKDRWDELAATLFDLTQEVRAGRQQDATGLDPETEAPFLGVLKAESRGDTEPDAATLGRLRDTTVELVSHIRQEVRLVGFWQNPHAQEVLRRWVVQFLDDRDVLPFDRLPATADRIVELAKVNHPKLIR